MITFAVLIKTEFSYQFMASAGINSKSWGISGTDLNFQNPSLYCSALNRFISLTLAGKETQITFTFSHLNALFFIFIFWLIIKILKLSKNDILQKNCQYA